MDAELGGLFDGIAVHAAAATENGLATSQFRQDFRRENEIEMARPDHIRIRRNGKQLLFRPATCVTDFEIGDGIQPLRHPCGELVAIIRDHGDDEFWGSGLHGKIRDERD